MARSTSELSRNVTDQVDHAWAVGISEKRTQIPLNLCTSKMYLIERTMQPLQHLWPQLVCTGSRNPRRQIHTRFPAVDRSIHDITLRPWFMISLQRRIQDFS